MGVIGTNEVTVSGYYYKVIFDRKDRMVALILPNASSTESLGHFVVTVDQIEEETGIDFFPELNDDQEKRLEGRIDTTGWSFQ